VKAIIQTHYGSAESLKITQIDTPNPKPDEIQIKVMATSLNAPDWRLLRGKPFMVRLSSGLFKPKHLIKGTDAAGIVTAVGGNVKTFKLGDEVYADLADSGFGAFADYVCINEKLAALKPKSLSFLEAASLPLTAITALQAVRDKAKVKAGDRVLIVGASGGVGSYAIQHCKCFGAHVTAVVSTGRIAQATALGADATIDYTRTPLDQVSEKYDIVLTINGFYPLETYKKLLTSTGHLVLVSSGKMSQILAITAFGPLLSKKGGQTYSGFLARPSGADLAHLSALIDDGHFKPVIECEIAFEDIPKWLGELEKGHVGGKIVAWVNKE